MIIYGTALLAFCHLAGLFLGDLLGVAIGVKTNVGGVGIAMLLLIFLRLYLHKKGWLPKETEAGVGFWGAMYIPVVVAMSPRSRAVPSRCCRRWALPLSARAASPSFPAPVTTARRS